MHHGQTRGGNNEKHVKYVKKTRKLYKIRGTFLKVVKENNNFPEIMGNVAYYFCENI